MKKILKSLVGLLLGCSIVILISVINNPVTASILLKVNEVPQSTYISAVPVKALEVGTYGDLAARATVGDNLTPDHIPSFAAIKKFREKIQGGAITGAAETTLRNNTNTIVYSSTLHQSFSRTYGGRNTPTQIASDASNLKAAFALDRDTIRPKLIQSGLSAAAIDAAFTKLDTLNKQLGLYQ